MLLGEIVLGGGIPLGRASMPSKVSRDPQDIILDPRESYDCRMKIINDVAASSDPKGFALLVFVRDKVKDQRLKDWINDHIDSFKEEFKLSPAKFKTFEKAMSILLKFDFNSPVVLRNIRLLDSSKRNIEVDNVQYDSSLHPSLYQSTTIQGENYPHNIQPMVLPNIPLDLQDFLDIDISSIEPENP